MKPRSLFAVMVGLTFAGQGNAAAQAGQAVPIAPPAAWVSRVSIPAHGDAPAALGARWLLRDSQVRFDPDGATVAYWNDAMEVLSSDGLAKAANVTLPWNPELDQLTVHHLHILRGGKVIDVLKDQQFTVLHRETDLERASLDGRLTATLQIAGLQVGDIVDLAATQRHRDPALDGHHERWANFVAGALQSRLTAQWGHSDAITWHVLNGLPMPEVAKGATTTLSLDVAGLRTPVLPKGAPPRFREADEVQFSDWRDWAQVSGVMAPLYAKAATLSPDSPLAAEAAKIAAQTRDPVSRAEAALALVQDQVRYLFVGLNDGGYVPAAADETWRRRYGDCKGKTVLLLSMLHALGIQAQPVLVNASGLGDTIPGRLPGAGAFNHVLVRATIGGRDYWLDGTRKGDRHLAAIRTPAFRWGLPVQASGAALVPMMPPPAEQPFIATVLRLDASAGLDKPVPVHGELTFRGDAATTLNRQFGELSSDVRERSLRETWRKSYPYITPTTVSARFDPAAGVETLSVDGVAALDWQDGALELNGMQLGAAVDWTREPGPNADAPYAVAFPAYVAHNEIIVLPDHGRGITLDPLPVDRTIAATAMHREGGIVDGVATVAVSQRTLAPEFPAAAAASSEDALRKLTHEHVYLRRAAASSPQRAG
ncbi:DUF3857 domain-containing transglutaminase family protein [Sphingomonas sp. CLY1604]|uniref:DUF3857 domain-containing transglutaminase family protein n=1 Tax=Sphingomonas sp. CLY1604 TaxID=3457786 RepID=UPI003FD6F70C